MTQFCGGLHRLVLWLDGSRLLLLTVASLALQLLCGLWWFGQGNFDLATTQLKLASSPGSMLVCLYLASADHHVRAALAASPLARLGDVSFGVYLSRIPFVVVASKLLGLVGLSGTMGGALVMWAFALGGSAVLVWVCSRLLPDRPCGALGFS